MEFSKQRAKPIELFPFVRYFNRVFYVFQVKFLFYLQCVSVKHGIKRITSFVSFYEMSFTKKHGFNVKYTLTEILS